MFDLLVLVSIVGGALCTQSTIGTVGLYTKDNKRLSQKDFFLFH